MSELPATPLKRPSPRFDAARPRGRDSLRAAVPPRFSRTSGVGCVSAAVRLPGQRRGGDSVSVAVLPPPGRARLSVREGV